MLTAAEQLQVKSAARRLVILLKRFDTNEKRQVLTPRQARQSREKAWDEFSEVLKEVG